MGHIAQQSNHNFLYFLSEKWPSALQSPLINGVEIGRGRGGREMIYPGISPTPHEGDHSKIA